MLWQEWELLYDPSDMQLIMSSTSFPDAEEEISREAGARDASHGGGVNSGSGAIGSGSGRDADGGAEFPTIALNTESDDDVFEVYEAGPGGRGGRIGGSGSGSGSGGGGGGDTPRAGAAVVSATVVGAVPPGSGGGVGGEGKKKRQQQQLERVAEREGDCDRGCDGDGDGDGDVDLNRYVDGDGDGDGGGCGSGSGNDRLLGSGRGGGVEWRGKEVGMGEGGVEVDDVGVSEVEVVEKEKRGVGQKGNKKGEKKGKGAPSDAATGKRGGGDRHRTVAYAKSSSRNAAGQGDGETRSRDDVSIEREWKGHEQELEGGGEGPAQVYELESSADHVERTQTDDLTRTFPSGGDDDDDDDETQSDPGFRPRAKSCQTPASGASEGSGGCSRSSNSASSASSGGSGGGGGGSGLKMLATAERWRCECGSLAKAGRRSCRMCGSAAPGSVTAAAAAAAASIASAASGPAFVSAAAAASEAPTPPCKSSSEPKVSDGGGYGRKRSPEIAIAPPIASPATCGGSGDGGGDSGVRLSSRGERCSAGATQASGRSGKCSGDGDGVVGNGNSGVASPRDRLGRWQCGCGCLMKAGGKRCIMCREPRPCDHETVRLGAGARNGSGSSGGSGDRGGGSGARGGVERAQARPGSGSSGEIGGSSSGGGNLSNRVAVAWANGSSGVGVADRGARAKEGRWQCTACGSEYGAVRLKCRACGAPKPTRPDAAAAGAEAPAAGAEVTGASVASGGGGGETAETAEAAPAATAASAAPESAAAGSKGCSTERVSISHHSSGVRRSPGGESSGVAVDSTVVIGGGTPPLENNDLSQGEEEGLGELFPALHRFEADETAAPGCCGNGGGDYGRGKIGRGECMRAPRGGDGEPAERTVVVDIPRPPPPLISLPPPLPLQMSFPSALDGAAPSLACDGDGVMPVVEPPPRGGLWLPPPPVLAPLSTASAGRSSSAKEADQSPGPSAPPQSPRSPARLLSPSPWHLAASPESPAASEAVVPSGLAKGGDENKVTLCEKRRSKTGGGSGGGDRGGSPITEQNLVARLPERVPPGGSNTINPATATSAPGVPAAGISPSNGALGPEVAVSSVASAAAAPPSPSKSPTRNDHGSGTEMDDTEEEEWDGGGGGGGGEGAFAYGAPADAPSPSPPRSSSCHARGGVACALVGGGSRGGSGGGAGGGGGVDGSYDGCSGSCGDGVGVAGNDIGGDGGGGNSSGGGSGGGGGGAGDGVLEDTDGDADVACGVCGCETSKEDDPIILCDAERCGTAVHADCYGVAEVPEGAWLCDPCSDMHHTAAALAPVPASRSAGFSELTSTEPSQGKGEVGLLELSTAAAPSVPPPRCTLCDHPGGAQKLSECGKWAHVVCVWWTPELSTEKDTVRPRPLAALDPDRRGLTCSVCHGRGGAAIQCAAAEPQCLEACHPFCALRAGFLLREEDGVFELFCRTHSRRAREKEGDAVEEGGLEGVGGKEGKGGAVGGGGMVAMRDSEGVDGGGEEGGVAVAGVAGVHEIREMCGVDGKATAVAVATPVPGNSGQDSRKKTARVVMTPPTCRATPPGSPGSTASPGVTAASGNAEHGDSDEEREGSSGKEGGWEGKREREEQGEPEGDEEGSGGEEDLSLLVELSQSQMPPRRRPHGPGAGARPRKEIPVEFLGEQEDGVVESRAMSGASPSSPATPEGAGARAGAGAEAGEDGDFSGGNTPLKVFDMAPPPRLPQLSLADGEEAVKLTPDRRRVRSGRLSLLKRAGVRKSSAAVVAASKPTVKLSVTKPPEGADGLFDSPVNSPFVNSPVVNSPVVSSPVVRSPVVDSLDDSPGDSPVGGRGRGGDRGGGGGGGGEGCDGLMTLSQAVSPVEAERNNFKRRRLHKVMETRVYRVFLHGF